jgi:hypothetical protein
MKYTQGPVAGLYEHGNESLHHGGTYSVHVIKTDFIVLKLLIYLMKLKKQFFLNVCLLEGLMDNLNQKRNS